MSTTAAARRARAEENRRKAAANRRRAQRRHRRIRLANLKEREAKLIAHIKKLRSLRLPRSAINAHKMDLAKVRENIRQIGGKPEPHPFGKTAKPAPARPRGPVRPSEGRRRADEEDGYSPEPEDEEEEAPPPDEDEEQEQEQEVDAGWAVEGRRRGRGRSRGRMRRGGGGRGRGGRQRQHDEEEAEQDPDAGWDEAGYDDAAAMLAGPPVRREKPAKAKRRVPPPGERKPGFFERVFKPSAEAIRRRAAAQQARPKKGGGFLAKMFKKPVVQKVGGNMALTVRPGFRAAIMQVKPGLYVVAEVPAAAIRNGIGDEEVGILPLLVAPLVATAVQKRMAKRKRDQAAGKEQKLLPGPVDEGTDLRSFMGLEGDDIPAWIDSEVAEEVGCPCEVETRR